MSLPTSSINSISIAIGVVGILSQARFARYRVISEFLKETKPESLRAKGEDIENIKAAEIINRAYVIFLQNVENFSVGAPRTQIPFFYPFGNLFILWFIRELFIISLIPDLLWRWTCMIRWHLGHFSSNDDEDIRWLFINEKVRNYWHYRSHKILDSTYKKNLIRKNTQGYKEFYDPYFKYYLDHLLASTEYKDDTGEHKVDDYIQLCKEVQAEKRKPTTRTMPD